MTTTERAELGARVSYALNGFNRYMNRPLARVHVYTWRLANAIDPNAPAVRLVRPYRSEEVNRFRWRVAQYARSLRHAGLVELPRYDEARAIYTPTENLD